MIAGLRRRPGEDRVPEARWPLLLLAALLAACGPRAAGAAELVLSRETCGGLFLVPLTWSSRSGASHELTAVFDTGGGGPAVIDPDAVERGFGRRVPEGQRVRMTGVAAGEARFTEFRPRVHQLDHISRVLGRELDVFLPFRAFEDFLLTLDYPRGELRISRGALPAPDGVEVFSARGEDHRPWLEVEIGGRKRMLLIDSGSTGALSLRPGRHLRWEKLLPPLQVNQKWGRLVRRRIGRLDDSVAVGRLTLDRPLAEITDGTELIGAQALAPLVVTFDQKRRRVRMRNSLEGPFRIPPYRGSGAVQFPREDGLEVVDVVAGTPAERSGVLRGDRVIAIDGVGVYDRGCRPSGGPQADEERWTVRRGERTLDLTVPVIDLLP